MFKIVSYLKCALSSPLMLYVSALDQDPRLPDMCLGGPMARHRRPPPGILLYVFLISIWTNFWIGSPTCFRSRAKLDHCLRHVASPHTTMRSAIATNNAINDRTPSIRSTMATSAINDRTPTMRSAIATHNTQRCNMCTVDQHVDVFKCCRFGSSVN